MPLAFGEVFVSINEHSVGSIPDREAAVVPLVIGLIICMACAEAYDRRTPANLCCIQYPSIVRSRRSSLKPKSGRWCYAIKHSLFPFHIRRMTHIFRVIRNFDGNSVVRWLQVPPISGRTGCWCRYPISDKGRQVVKYSDIRSFTEDNYYVNFSWVKIRPKDYLSNQKDKCSYTLSAYVTALHCREESPVTFEFRSLKTWKNHQHEEVYINYLDVALCRCFTSGITINLIRPSRWNTRGSVRLCIVWSSHKEDDLDKLL